MSKKTKTPKNQVNSDHYVNLMLLTVLEAMLLLIGQLIIYNGNAVYPGAIRGAVIPAILIIAAVAFVVFTVLFVVKKNRSFIKPMIFAAYVALLMVIIRYIPNTLSEITGRWVVNDMKGMKIGAIASSIYVFINFIFL
ncbi:MAG: hypothetical protein IKL42_04710, partial [Clostridia bacterium]|nr:hypothetical protein [Clostridia bacterium]